MLEEILRNNFGCNQPFRDEPLETDDGGLDWLTDEGHEAYRKLVDTIYGLANTGVITSTQANSIIDQLDAITNLSDVEFAKSI